MDDVLFYCILGGFLAGVILAACRDIKGPVCAGGECNQGRLPCNCRSEV